MIEFSDMVALSTLANGKSDLPKDVSPMYYSGGVKIGNQMISGIAIDPASPGGGYKPGDYLQGFGGALVLGANVETVDSLGGLVGIRIVELYGIDPATTIPSSPADFTSIFGGAHTSGSGAKIIFTHSVVGPNKNYDFGAMGLGIDFEMNYGNVTAFYLINGGSNYQAGDNLSFAELPDVVLTVNTVDGSGAILTTTLTTGTAVITVPENVSALSATGGSGSGSVFGGFFTLAQKPQWLTELNRMRANLFPVINDKVTNGGVYQWARDSISGGAATSDKVAGWPISSPDINNSNLAFWYADTGSSESVSVSATGPVDGSGQFTITTANFVDSSTAPPTSGPVTMGFVTKKTFSIMVGGDAPVLVQGDFVIPFLCYQGGTYDSSTGWTLDSISSVPTPTVDTSLWMSGSTTTFAPTAWNPSGSTYLYVRLRVNATISPGKYSVVVTMPATPSDSEVISGSPPFLVVDSAISNTRILLQADSVTSVIAGSGYNTFNPPTTYGSGYPVVTGSTLGPGISAPGIHNSKSILKIDCSSWFGTAPFGLISLFEYENNFVIGTPAPVPYQAAPTAASWMVSPFSSPTFGPEKAGEQTVSITSTTSGLWTGNSAAVATVNARQPSDMPWNYLRHKSTSPYPTCNPMLLGDLGSGTDISNSYDQSLPVESQLEPPLWIESHVFTLGFCIQDANGNLQKVTTSGTSGASIPSWNNVEGGTTLDGTVVWTCYLSLHLPTTWTSLTTKNFGDTIIDDNGNTQQAIVGGTTGSIAPSWQTSFGAQTTDGTITWKLTSVAKLINPAVHRSLCVPRYPSYWDSETIDSLKPPTSTSGLTAMGAYDQWIRVTYHAPDYDAGWQEDNQAYGWWIYSVGLHRITANPVNGVNLPALSEVSVTIGCIRSGSFVSFGTWNTGQVINVLWPVFTSDALVYQCSERIQVEPMAIAAVTPGMTLLGYPIPAAFVSDVTGLLGLIS